MSDVKAHEPIVELIARKLHGISSVPKDEQMRMVSRAAYAALEYHKEELDRLASENADLRTALKAIKIHQEVNMGGADKAIFSAIWNLANNALSTLPAPKEKKT